MIKIKNISFRKYASLTDRTSYDYAISYANVFSISKDHLKIGDLTKKPFGLVKDMQQDMSIGITWDKMLDYMSQLSGVNVKKLLKKRLTEIIQTRNYIVKSIEYIAKVEGEVLFYEPTDEEIAAGIDQFNVYGVYNQMLSIAGNDPTKIPLVRSMPYEDAFVFLCNQKTRNDYEVNLWSIRNKPK